MEIYLYAQTPKSNIPTSAYPDNENQIEEYIIMYYAELFAKYFSLRRQE